MVATEVDFHFHWIKKKKKSFKNHTYTKVTQTSFRSESETKMAGRRRTERAQFSLSTTELGAAQRRGGGDIMALRERERENVQIFGQAKGKNES